MDMIEDKFVEACAGDNVTEAKRMIEECQPDMRHCGYLLLRDSFDNNYTKVLKYLIEECNVAIPPKMLYQAADAEDKEMVSYLMEQGARHIDLFDCETMRNYNCTDAYAFCEKIIQEDRLSKENQKLAEENAQKAERSFKENLNMLKNIGTKPVVRRRPKAKNKNQGL